MYKCCLTVDQRRVKSNGRYPIKIFVHYAGNKFYLNTGYDTFIENWIDGSYSSREDGYKIKNLCIKSLLNKVESYLISLQISESQITSKQLRNNLLLLINNRIFTISKRFVDYIEEYKQHLQKPGTIRNYSQTQKKILLFDPLCTFETIDKQWLESLEKWFVDAGLSINAYSIHLRNIRTVFNWAIDEQITTLYPFRKFKIKQEETRKRNLTLDQLRILKDYDVDPFQEEYRDMFMLMFYLIGVNAVDLFTAKPEQLINGRFEYRRAKTNKLYSIKVEKEAIELINKYRGRNYLLSPCDRYSNHQFYLQHMNMALKKIGGKDIVKDKAGKLRKIVYKPLFPDLSTYWCRHTWATIAANLDISFETISAALGHNYGAAVTNIYIDFNQRKIDEANRKVIDCLFGKN